MKLRILFLAWFFYCLSGLIAQSGEPKTVSVEERINSFVAHIAPKIKLDKNQKDSLATIYIQYMDDLEKYHAGNNSKVIAYMMKARDEKVKTLLRDSVKFTRYLLVISEINKK